MIQERVLSRAVRAQIHGGGSVQAIVLSLSLLASPFGVIPEASAASGVLEEIVVSVRRREEIATDVPISITALTAADLEKASIDEFSDLGSHVPSLSISSNTSGSNIPLVGLRGQRPSETLLTLDPAVPLYFAEIPVTPVYGANLGLYDMAGVQVLKGPQGTLFGINSTGGAVLFAPQLPSNEVEGYVKGEVGNYNLARIQGAVSLPVSDAVLTRLALQKTDRDGYQSNVADNSLRCKDCMWDEDSLGVRFITSVDVGDFRNLTTIAYDKNNSIGRQLAPLAFNPSGSLSAIWHRVFNGGAGIGGPEIDEAIERQSKRSPHDIESDQLPDEKVENQIFINTTEYDFNDDLTLKNVFGYRKVNFYQEGDTDATAMPIFGSIVVDSPTVPPGYVGRGRSVDTEQFSEELQLIGYAFDSRLEWIAGVFWYRMEGDESNLSVNSGVNPNWPAGPAPSPGLQTIYNYARYGTYGSSAEASVVNESYAIFGEGTFDIDDQWSVTLGLRQTWDTRELTTHARRTNSANLTLPPACIVRDESNNLLPDGACSRTVEETFSSPTGRLSINYSPDSGQLIYGSISSGYRTGGFDMRGNDNVTLEPFDPEKVINYEIGHKGEWSFDSLGSVRTAIALYWQDYSDIQKTQGIELNGAFYTSTFNAAEAVIRGADVEITYAPTTNLVIGLAYSYVDAYYTEWFRDDPTFGMIDNSSSAFVYVPDHSVTGSVSYTLPLDPSIGEVSLIANAYWQSKVDTHPEKHYFAEIAAIRNWSPQLLDDAYDISIADPYALWNFRVNWSDVMGSKFDVAAYVNNAFDEEYIVGGLNVISSVGYASASYGAPRTFGASLQWSF